MRFQESFSILTLAAIVAHVIFDYLRINELSSKNPQVTLENEFELPTRIALIKLIVPFSTLLIPFGYYEIFQDNIFETREGMQYFIISFLLAFILGPTIVYLFFSRYKAAILGLSIRIILSSVLLKLGWLYG